MRYSKACAGPTLIGGVLFALLLSGCGGSDSGASPGASLPATGSGPPAAGAPPPASAPQNKSPTITGAPSTTVAQNQEYVFQPAASDPDGQPLTFSIVNKPDWATLDASSGELSGTPDAGDVGTYAGIRITVSDGTNTVALPSFSITVVQGGDGSVTLAWQAPDSNVDGTPLADLAGYRIHYGSKPSAYTKAVTVNNPGVTRYVVENLVPGTYYFAMTSFNAAGVDSDYSAEVQKTLN